MAAFSLFLFPFEHFSKTIIAMRCILVYIKRVYFFKLFFTKKKNTSKQHYLLQHRCCLSKSISRLLTTVSEQKAQSCTETVLKRIRVKLILGVYLGYKYINCKNCSVWASLSRFIEFMAEVEHSQEKCSICLIR